MHGDLIKKISWEGNYFVIAIAAMPQKYKLRAVTQNVDCLPPCIRPAARTVEWRTMEPPHSQCPMQLPRHHASRKRRRMVFMSCPFGWRKARYG